MGDGLTGDDSPRKTPSTYSDIFRKAFPEYLAMGMPAKEYWEGEADLVTGYREAYRIRIENEERAWDRDAWLAGIYIQKALASVPLLVNGFVPKGAHTQEYPEKPMLQKAHEEKREADRKKSEEEKTKLAMALMQAAVNKFNKNFLKRQAEKQKREVAGTA